MAAAALGQTLDVFYLVRAVTPGKYVVPGFLDMHYHALEAVDRPPTYWPLMIGNGVTGFREMSGSSPLLERGRQYRQEYHFLMRIRGEHICEVREYLDTLHVHDVWVAKDPP